MFYSVNTLKIELIFNKIKEAFMSIAYFSFVDTVL